MARRPQNAKLENIYDKVQEHPGKKPGYIARLLGLHRSDVIRTLPSLDQEGLYLYEDDRGGLWAFRKSR